MSKKMNELIRDLNASDFKIDNAVAHMLKNDKPAIFHFPDGYDTIPEDDFMATYEFAQEVSKAGQLRLPSEVTVFRMDVSKSICNKEKDVTEAISIMLYKDDEIGITTYIIDREGNTRASNHIGAFKNGKIYVGIEPAGEDIMREKLAEYGDVDELCKHLNYNTKFETQRAMALLVFLSSKSAKIMPSNDMTKLNAARAKKDLPPINEFKTVTLHIPGRAKNEGRGKGTSSPKRMHYRRGHLRKIASGNIVAVSPSWVGSAELGIIQKDYKISTT
jgi:hypothetical protein